MTLKREHLKLEEFLKRDYNAKITEIEGKIPSIKGLSTTDPLNALRIRYPTLLIQSSKQIVIQILYNRIWL